MTSVQGLRHTVWECRHHVVWTPKYRRRCCMVSFVVILAKSYGVGSSA